MARTAFVARVSRSARDHPRVVKDAVCGELLKRKTQERKEKARAAKEAKELLKRKAQEKKRQAAAAKAAKANKNWKKAPPEIVYESKKHF